MLKIKKFKRETAGGLAKQKEDESSQIKNKQ